MTCGECGNVTAPGAGFPNHVYCKRFLLHMEKREDANICWDFIPKPITNADRIRVMTDEELAAFLCNQQDVTGCSMCVAIDFCHYGHTGMIDWLKQEAKDEA